ncbi:DNA methyltransferase 1-associated protein 1-like [Oppia nitens]|uniref:DNA methyltransferase 1-associated protein 1-like n=1 Tax=Oppia nitens TaxID=1686743 RepID=UPI0023D9EDBA|nr:DNA methyltransferase 1-associated protein 1-like [Oppia nitens]
MADVLDILDLDRNDHNNSNNDSHNDNNKQKNRRKRASDLMAKRPEGMHRELYALLYADNKDNPSLMPTDIGFQNKSMVGYKQIKAKLGLKRVRPWIWTRFSPKDKIELYHWRREVDKNKEYPFARLNTSIEIPGYNDSEYQQLLTCDGWSKTETDHLFDLCRRFDLRFIIIHDRWDRIAFPNRSVEDLKDRYYNICNILAKYRALPGQEPKLRVFDADHERKRKEQLIKLYDRTPEQMEEEQHLLNELRKIEMRKKEREKKTQDLQKLITAADTSVEARKMDQQARSGGSRPGRKKTPHIQRSARETIANTSSASATPNLETAGIKFPEIKASGATLRSQRMKLPAAVGQKKTKAIEQLLNELNIELHPMPTEEICQHFNELRSDMVLLYELKIALSNCEYELQSLKHQFEASQPGKILDIPTTLFPSTTTVPPDAKPDSSSTTSSPTKKISEVIDLGSGPGTPNRKRRAAIEQLNLMKKLKKN